MTYDLRSLEGQRSHRFREYPIEADHHADPDTPEIVHIEWQIAWSEEFFLPVKEVDLAVAGLDLTAGA
jgi:hypothetical protein